MIQRSSSCHLFFPSNVLSSLYGIPFFEVSVNNSIASFVETIDAESLL
jgi:hypothetical protein